MAREHDHELEELFEDDADLRELANVLKATPRSSVEPDPAFRATLRRRLMDEAWRAQDGPAAAPWYRRLLTGPAGLVWRGQASIMPRLAWSGGIAALLVIALVAVLMLNRPAQHQRIVVNIPIKNAAAVRSIPVQFNQPMDRASTEKAISIQPATEVSYQWPKADQLDIAPKNGALASDTRYSVTVGAGARTADGQTLQTPQTATFVTAPPPATPPATPTPAPSTNPNPTLVGAHRVGDIGDAPAAWAADGGQLYFVDPSGQLNSYSVSTGAVSSLATGVKSVTATPNGPAYVLQGGDVVWNGQTLKGADPTAIGLRAGKLELVSGNQVTSPDKSIRVPLGDTPTAASFSPDGNRLAYVARSGLHLVDLVAGKDQQVQNVQALGAWSPRTSNLYAYPNESSVVLIDMTRTGNESIAAASVTGVSWSPDDQLLLAGPAGLLIVPASGGTPNVLSSDTVTQPQWSPAAGKSLSYDADGGLWVATVSNGEQQVGTQQDVVGAFMSARKSGQAMQAQGFLDSGGQTAFQNLPLTYGNGQTLSRYQVLLDEPGHMVVRLVVDEGGVETAIDETLSLVRTSDRRVWIHGASDAAARPLGQGPEVVSVRIASNQVTVMFDSDLDPSTVGGVTVSGLRPSGASYDPRARSVVLTFANPLDAGNLYHLQVTGNLRDVNHRAAAPVTFAFNGLTMTSSPSPSPTPKPSATPSPTPGGANPSPSPTS